MTVIYLDTLFLLNMGLDGLLLSAANCLTGSRIHWRRILFASALGAGYAALVFVTGSPLLAHPSTRVLTALGMVWLASRGKSGLLRILGAFFLLSCTLAGGVLLMQHTGLGSLSSRTGFPLTAGDGRLLMLCGAGEYLLVSILARRPKSGGIKTVPVLLTCEGRKVLLQALVDTGNLLRDPITGEAVMIADMEGAAMLFPPGCRPEPADFQHPAQLLSQLSESWDAGRLRILPYHAVGTPQGLLLAVRTDRVEVNGQVSPNRLVAVTGTALSSNGSYHGIIGVGNQEGIL